jgi:hypothetical protein
VREKRGNARSKRRVCEQKQLFFSLEGDIFGLEQEDFHLASAECQMRFLLGVNTKIFQPPIVFII